MPVAVIAPAWSSQRFRAPVETRLLQTVEPIMQVLAVGPLSCGDALRQACGKLPCLRPTRNYPAMAGRAL